MDETDKLVAAQLAAAVVQKRDKTVSPRESVEIYLRIRDHLSNTAAIQASMKSPAKTKAPAKTAPLKPVFRG